METKDNGALLDYYAASGGNFLPTFRDNQSSPYSKVKNLKLRTVVTACTTSCNTKRTMDFPHTLYLFVSYESHNKEQLFLRAINRYIFVIKMECKLCVVGS